MSAKYRFAHWFVALLGCWLLASCTFDDTRKHCSRDSDCEGDRCYKGFCVMQRPSETNLGGQGSAGEEAGEGGGGAGGAGGSRSGEGGSRSMDSGTAGKGGSGSSTRDSGASPECSGDDTRPCQASWENAADLGGCGEGKEHCINGVWGACTPDRMLITTETCNGLDDDCDGQMDEDSAVQCFPSDKKGCKSNGQSGYNCQGICKAGTQKCSGGSLQPCSDEVAEAAADDCSTENIDENCDGTPNDGCDCMGNASRKCPTDTTNVCTVGNQQCMNGKWGACVGVVLKQLEVCDGMDNDCNGKMDDVTGVDMPCTVANKSGVCSLGTFKCLADAMNLQCVATTPNPAPETCDNKDNDCNGMVDDVPASQLQTDSQNCGACRKTCGASDKCCGGQCVNSTTDGSNCGACGKTCSSTETCMAGACVTNQTADAGMCDAMGGCASGEICCNGTCVPSDLNNCGKCGTVCTGMAPACCSDACVDLATSNSNCGKCGNVCPTLDGGASCMCATTGTPGMFECRNGTAACP